MRRGFVTIDGELCYYVDGNVGPLGLQRIGDGYYYVESDGRLLTNGTYFVTETNGLSIETAYTFDETGRIVG